jgi:hypothetical protein
MVQIGIGHAEINRSHALRARSAANAARVMGYAGFV